MPDPARRLIDLDHAHVWHPFTPMRQWREHDPLIIEAGEGDELIDAAGNRYIDGVSSIWCNVHGHRVPQIDQAIRDQLDRIAHTTMLGLVNEPATELAERLVDITPEGLNHVFYTDSGATATEVAFKMAVGSWFHSGQPQRNTLLAVSGAYHGDTTGAMSVGYCDVFHRPFESMVFEVAFAPAPHVEPDTPPPGKKRTWPLEDADKAAAARDEALNALDAKLTELGDTCAAVVIEPLVQGAAGLVVQPPGYLAGVAALCKKHGTLLIADEVATGFGRTGEMFACAHEDVQPDVICLGKGITGGYLPLAATLCTDAISEAFEGALHEMRTLYHGHTYTGNPLAAAAANATIDLFGENHELLAEVRRKAARLAEGLAPLRDAKRCPIVRDVRQCGLMVGIEVHDPKHAPATGETHDDPASNADAGTPLGDFGESPHMIEPGARRIGYEVCDACRPHGLIIRPLGDVIILMPPLSITDAHLDHLADTVCTVIQQTR